MFYSIMILALIQIVMMIFTFYIYKKIRQNTTDACLLFNMMNEHYLQMIKELSLTDGHLLDAAKELTKRIKNLELLFLNNAPRPTIKPIPTITKISDDEDFGEIIDEDKK